MTNPLLAALSPLALRIPGAAAVVAVGTSAAPLSAGEGRAWAAPPRPARPFDLDAAVAHRPTPSPEDPPDHLPPLGWFDAYGEANPVAWAAGDDAVSPGSPPVFRSRADAEWLRVADAECAGILEGEVYVDVDEEGAEWLFLLPGTLTAIRLRGGWILLAHHGEVVLGREIAARRSPAFEAPDWTRFGVGLSSSLEAEARDTLDHVGMLVRLGRSTTPILELLRTGSAPPHLEAIRAWAAELPRATWLACSDASVARAEVLLAAVPSLLGDEAGARWAAEERDVLESDRAVLAAVEEAAALEVVLGLVDAAAEVKDLGEVEFEPVAVRLQAEARSFARWWGRP